MRYAGRVWGRMLAESLSDARALQTRRANNDAACKQMLRNDAWLRFEPRISGSQSQRSTNSRLDRGFVSFRSEHTDRRGGWSGLRTVCFLSGHGHRKHIDETRQFLLRVL